MRPLVQASRPATCKASQHESVQARTRTETETETSLNDPVTDGHKPNKQLYSEFEAAINYQTIVKQIYMGVKNIN